jgi:hypothetical protein
VAGLGRLGNDFRELILLSSLKVVRQGALRRGRKGRQLAFLSAYGLSCSIEDISKSMGLRPRAVVELLRRASDAVELVLLFVIESQVCLGGAMSHDALRARIAGELQRFLVRDAEGLRVAEVIHRRPCPTM